MATVHSSMTAPVNVEPIPELCGGDRLTRAQFERRYTAMPHVKKAELVEGVVYMPSPVSQRHAEPHFRIIGWLAHYASLTPGVEGGDNATVRLDLENEVQPDAFLRVRPQFGGQSRDDGPYVGGAPELIAEITVSSASYDLHDKLRAYQRNGVREYLVWRVWDQAVDWFVLRDDRFEPMSVDSAGRYKSEVFPGLWLDPAALLRDDMPAVMAALQQGLASAEHAALVERLKQAGSGKS